MIMINSKKYCDIKFDFDSKCSVGKKWVKKHYLELLVNQSSTFYRLKSICLGVCLSFFLDRYSLYIVIIIIVIRVLNVYQLVI